MIGNRYTLDREIGRGGLGSVHLAWDNHLHRWVAVKRLHGDGREAAERAEAAWNEAKLLASLQHPHVVTIHDFLVEAGDVWVVMEFVSGISLEELQAPMTLEDFSDLARQVLEGLGAAHTLGMIHRDIKAGNIMLAEQPHGRFQAKILDFGLAKVLPAPSLQTTDENGSVLGSVYTMAPEQLEKQPLDARTDLYALGCVFYQALTLRSPFEGDNVVEVVAAHLKHNFVPLVELRPDLPAAVCHWVERLFSLEMDGRPASTRDAALQLQAILGFGLTQSVPSVPTKPVMSLPPVAPPSKSFSWVWVVAGSLVLAAGGWFIISGRSPEPAQTGTLAGGAAQKVPQAENVAVPPGSIPSPEPTPSPGATTAEKTIFSPTDRAGLLENLGKNVVVEGRISRTGENKAGTIRYLNFAGADRSDLGLVFFLRDSPGEFSMDILETFVGKNVRVSGVVSEYQGNPQIAINRLSQIEEVP